MAVATVVSDGHTVARFLRQGASVERAKRYQLCGAVVTAHDVDGPMSEGSAMGLQIGMEQVVGRPVLFVAGSGDEALLTRVANAIGCLMSTDDVRVVNVDDLLLSNVNATRAFLAHLVDGDAGERLVLSCNRLTGRKLLRRWGGDDIAIFADTSQAVVAAYPPVGQRGSLVPAPSAIGAGQPSR